MSLVFKPVKPVRPGYKRAPCEFSESTIFRTAKKQVVQEIEETMRLVGITKAELAVKLKVIDSAVHQYLDISRGIQLGTLVRLADALGCDVEINFIKRSVFTLADAEEVHDAPFE